MNISCDKRPNLNSHKHGLDESQIVESWNT